MVFAPAPGGYTDHEEVVPSGSRDLESAPRSRLSAHVGQIIVRGRGRRGRRGFGARQEFGATEGAQKLGE